MDILEIDAKEIFRKKLLKLVNQSGLDAKAQKEESLKALISRLVKSTQDMFRVLHEECPRLDVHILSDRIFVDYNAERVVSIMFDLEASTESAEMSKYIKLTFAIGARRMSTGIASADNQSFKQWLLDSIDYLAKLEFEWQQVDKKLK